MYYIGSLSKSVNKFYMSWMRLDFGFANTYEVNMNVLWIMYRFGAAESKLRTPAVSKGRFGFPCSGNRQRRD